MCIPPQKLFGKNVYQNTLRFVDKFSLEFNLNKLSLLPNTNGILAFYVIIFNSPMPSVALPSSCSLPPSAHTIIRFLISALHKHDLIFTKANTRHIDQWIELIVRLYLHDCNCTQRKKTHVHLKVHHEHVKNSIDAVFRFESILKNNKRNEQMVNSEEAIHNAWLILEQHLKTLVANRQRPKHIRMTPRKVRKKN